MPKPAAFNLSGWNTVKQLKPLMDSFWADEAIRTCKKCSAVMQPPAPVA